MSSTHGIASRMQQAPARSCWRIPRRPSGIRSEWKEHVGWLAPIAATVVAFAVTYYGPLLAKRTGERRALAIFFIFAFATAAIAGGFGAFINKLAPLR